MPNHQPFEHIHNISLIDPHKVVFCNSWTWPLCDQEYIILQSLPTFASSTFSIKVSEWSNWANLMTNKVLASLIVSVQWFLGRELTFLYDRLASLIMMLRTMCFGYLTSCFIFAYFWISSTVQESEWVTKYSFIISANLCLSLIANLYTFLLETPPM